MRKKKRVIASLLMVTMLVSYVPISSRAIQINDVEKQNEQVVAETWEQKISEPVWEAMDKAAETEKIPVWIWFTDINHQEVEKQVKKKTGLSATTLEVSFEPVPTDLKMELLEECTKESSERQDDIIEGVLSEYVEATDVQRTEEYKRTDAYVKAKRTTARDAYSENGMTFVNSTNTPTRPGVVNIILLKAIRTGTLAVTCGVEPIEWFIPII